MSANQLAIIKNELIAQILGVSDEAKILELKMSIDDIIGNDLPIQEVNESIAPYISDNSKPIDIEELKRKQGYSYFNTDELDKIVKEMNIQEPIEDLLKMI
jgi:hypothetical protein